MLGLDTYILKRVVKWIDKGKTDEEVISRAKIFMGSAFVIHLLLAILAGWRLYKLVKSKKKSTGDLIWPIILIVIAMIVPYGTETGEELTSIPSSALSVAATAIMSIAAIIVWFTKKDPQEKKNDDE
jgi:fumarate reductase subunit D